MSRLAFARIIAEPWGCRTIFHDGSEAPACVPDDGLLLRHYAVIAHRCGYGDDLLRYCQEHELAHLVCEQWLHQRPSRVLWALAHGEGLEPNEAAYEEGAAQMLQRFARAGEQPIIGGVDWFGMRDLFLREAAALQAQTGRAARLPVEQ